MRKMTLDWTTIFTEKTTEDGDFNAVTLWMEAERFRRLGLTFEVQNSTDTSGVVSPAIQTCNVPDTILTTLILSSGGANPTRNDKTGNGMSYTNGQADISGTTAGAQYVRLGFYFKGSTAGLKAARVQGFATSSEC